MNTGRRIIDYGKRITSTRWLFVLALWVPFLFTLNVAFLALQAHRSDDRDSQLILNHSFEANYCDVISLENIGGFQLEDFTRPCPVVQG